MARSYKIYIVENPDSGAVLAAFTVKHECVSWLISEAKKHYPIHVWTVMSVPDGRGFEHRDVPIIKGDKFVEMNS